MAYRMKRNGAGLASICILSTMVLVMLSSTACLYLGAEDSLRSRYPRNLVVDTAFLEDADTVSVRAAVDEVLTRYGEEAQNVLQYRYLDAAGYFLEDQVIFDQSKLTGFSLTDYSSVRQMFIVPLEDYNRLMGTEETLEAHEVLLYSTKSDYSYDTISLEGGETWRIKKTVPGFVDNGVDAMQIISSVFLFVPDMETVEIFFDNRRKPMGTIARINTITWALTCAAPMKKQIEIEGEISDAIRELSLHNEGTAAISIEGVAGNGPPFTGCTAVCFSWEFCWAPVFILGAGSDHVLQAGHGGI